MPWRLPTYNEFGGREDITNKFLTGFQTGTNFREMQARNKSREANLAMAEKELERRKAEDAAVQGRFETANLLDRDRLKETTRYNTENLQLGKDTLAQTGKHQAATEKLQSRQVAAEEGRLEIARKTYNREQQDWARKLGAETIGKVDTSTVEGMIRDLQLYGTKMAIAIRDNPEFEGAEADMVVKLIGKLTDSEKDTPEDYAMARAMIRGYQREVLGAEKVAEIDLKRQELELKGFGTAGKEEYNRLKSYVPMVLRKYKAALPVREDGEGMSEYIMKMISASENAFEIIEAQMKDPDPRKAAEATQDMKDLHSAYGRMRVLAGVADEDQAIAEEAKAGAGGAGDPAAGGTGLPAPTKIMINPSTGEKVGLINNQWQPIK